MRVVFIMGDFVMIQDVPLPLPPEYKVAIYGRVSMARFPCASPKPLTVRYLKFDLVDVGRIAHYEFTGIDG